MLNKLSYIEENTEAKKVIIFLHLKNLSSWIWINQTNSFKNYHSIYIDLPSHGDSYFNTDFSISQTTETLKEFIKDLNKEEINLVGIGLGGQVAIEFISKYPDLINKTIISSIECVSNFKCDYFNVLNETKPILDSKKEGFLTLAYLRHYGLPKEFYSDIFKDCENPNYDNLKKISYESMNYSLPKTIKDKNKEIMILYGEYDSIWVKKSSKEIKNKFNNSKILEIKGATQLWNIRKYKMFNKIVSTYLD